MTDKNEKRQRVSAVARFQIEGIHRWRKCPIEEVSYLREYHRHIFHIEAVAYVNHNDRDIEFIELSHKMRAYLKKKYYNKQYDCFFFDDASCEMLACELIAKFPIYECSISEDGEGGSRVTTI